jgi:hypothetical protein
MDANPFLPLSFIAGPALLANACAVMLNGASIRYNLAIGLWRDLQAELRGRGDVGVTPYEDRRQALRLANRRVVLLVRGLSLLFGAVGGFGFSALTGLTGAVLSQTQPGAWVEVAKDLTVASAAIGLICLLSAAAYFVLESRCTIGLLRLGLPPRSTREIDDEAVD